MEGAITYVRYPKHIHITTKELPYKNQNVMIFYSQMPKNDKVRSSATKIAYICSVSTQRKPIVKKTFLIIHIKNFSIRNLDQS